MHFIIIIEVLPETHPKGLHHITWTSFNADARSEEYLFYEICIGLASNLNPI
jgi:hypothetical protein